MESPEVAEEIAADVFRVVWQKWGDQPRADIAWLVTVARNMIGNAYRSRDRQRALQEKLRATAVLSFGDGSEYLAVHDAMAGLREKDRDILQLAYWDGLGTPEIADVLQCSESAAKVRLHRARAAFRKQMPAGAETIAQRMGA
ncbi:RNA polymerase sigma factor, sigma-70 family [compost metagenome]